MLSETELDYTQCSNGIIRISLYNERQKVKLEFTLLIWFWNCQDSIIHPINLIFIKEKCEKFNFYVSYIFTFHLHIFLICLLHVWAFYFFWKTVYCKIKDRSIYKNCQHMIQQYIKISWPCPRYGFSSITCHSRIHKLHSIIKW